MIPIHPLYGDNCEILVQGLGLQFILYICALMMKLLERSSDVIFDVFQGIINIRQVIF